MFERDGVRGRADFVAGVLKAPERGFQILFGGDDVAEEINRQQQLGLGELRMLGDTVDGALDIRRGFRCRNGLRGLPGANLLFANLPLRGFFLADALAQFLRHASDGVKTRLTVAFGKILWRERPDGQNQKGFGAVHIARDGNYL